MDTMIAMETQIASRSHSFRNNGTPLWQGLVLSAKALYPV